MHQNEKRKSATKEYLSFNISQTFCHKIVNIFEPITGWYLDHHGEAESKTVLWPKFAEIWVNLLSWQVCFPKVKVVQFFGGLLRSFSLGSPPHASIKSEPKCLFLRSKLLSCACYQSTPVSMCCDKQRLHSFSWCIYRRVYIWVSSNMKLSCSTPTLKVKTYSLCDNYTRTLTQLETWALAMQIQPKN